MRLGMASIISYCTYVTKKSIFWTKTIVEIPPKLSVSGFMGYLKGKSMAINISAIYEFVFTFIERNDPFSKKISDSRYAKWITRSRVARTRGFTPT